MNGGRMKLEHAAQNPEHLPKKPAHAELVEALFFFFWRRAPSQEKSSASTSSAWTGWGKELVHICCTML
jgi:hypothetical protein